MLVSSQEDANREPTGPKKAANAIRDTEPGDRKACSGAVGAAGASGDAGSNGFNGSAVGQNGNGRNGPERTWKRIH